MEELIDTRPDLLALVEAISRELDIDHSGQLQLDLERILEELRCRRSHAKLPGAGRAGTKRRGRKPWPEGLRRTFFERLRAAIRARHVTDGALAEALGVEQDFVYRLRRGRMAPSIPTLVPLADVLQVSADWLLGRRSDPNG